MAALAEVGASCCPSAGTGEAAGAKVDPDELEDFRQAWSVAVASRRRCGSPQNKRGAGQRFTLDELTAQFETDMWRLAPFGQEYPAPRAILEGAASSG